LGQQAVTAIEVIKKIAEGNVRITPDILVAGEHGSLLDVLISQLVQKGAKVPAVGVPQVPVVPGENTPA